MIIRLSIINIFRFQLVEKGDLEILERIKKRKNMMHTNIVRFSYIHMIQKRRFTFTQIVYTLHTHTTPTTHIIKYIKTPRTFFF